MIKLPKTYRTGGYILRIRREKTNSNFNVIDGFIVIDSRLKTGFEVMEDFVHECWEASMETFGYRYNNWKRCPIFVFNHEHYHDIVGEVARGVFDLLEANGLRKRK